MPKKSFPLESLPKIGERLVLARERAGLDQKNAARTLGIPAPNLSRYETGYTEPSTGFFLAAASIYGVTLDWLLTGEESEPRAGPRPGEALIRLPRGDSEPLSKQDAELVEKVLVVLRAKGEKADQFSSLLKHTVDVTFTGVRQDNRLSGSPGETAMQHKKGA